MRRLLILLCTTALLITACGDDDAVVLGTTVPETVTTAAAPDSTAAPTTTVAPTTTEAPTTTSTTVPPTTVPASCEDPAVPIGIGDSRVDQLDAIDAPYPANALYFCFTVPEGVAEITIDLTGLAGDLDMYVGFGSLDSVQGFDLSDGAAPEWVSNDFGLSDEQVVINAPEPGTYYIEVTPYDRESSPYTLTVSD